MSEICFEKMKLSSGKLLSLSIMTLNNTKNKNEI